MGNSRKINMNKIVAVIAIAVLFNPTLSTNGADCVKFVNGELKAASAFTAFKESWVHFEERMIEDFKKHKLDKKQCNANNTITAKDLGKKAAHGAEYHRILTFIHQQMTHSNIA